MSLPTQIERSGFNPQVVRALKMAGVNLGSHTWDTGKRKGHKITFTCHGDREMVRGVLTDFIEDEFGGINCRFFAQMHDHDQCYVLFDIGRTPR